TCSNVVPHPVLEAGEQYGHPKPIGESCLVEDVRTHSRQISHEQPTLSYVRDDLVVDAIVVVFAIDSVRSVAASPKRRREASVESIIHRRVKPHRHESLIAGSFGLAKGLGQSPTVRRQNALVRVTAGLPQVASFRKTTNQAN